MTAHRAQMATTVCRYLKEAPAAMYDIGVGPVIKSEWNHILKIYPQMKMFGCEPHPDTYRQQESRFPGQLKQTAIHSQKRTATLNLKSRLSKFGAFSLIDLGVSYEQKIEVSCITLDEFDEWAGKQESIILWMDIEGSELDALKSAPNLLSSGRVKAINLEVRPKTNSSDWPTDKEIRAWLELNGYNLVLNYNNQKTHWDAIYLPQEIAKTFPPVKRGR
jgi:FkbM family methyltransferase